LIIYSSMCKLDQFGIQCKLVSLLIAFTIVSVFLLSLIIYSSRCKLEQFGIRCKLIPFVIGCKLVPFVVMQACISTFVIANNLLMIVQARISWDVAHACTIPHRVQACISIFV